MEYLKDLNDKSVKEDGFKIMEVKTLRFDQLETLTPLGWTDMDIDCRMRWGLEEHRIPINYSSSKKPISFQKGKVH